MMATIMTPPSRTAILGVGPGTTNYAVTDRLLGLGHWGLGFPP
jgi:hypothetical protein